MPVNTVTHIHNFSPLHPAIDSLLDGTFRPAEMIAQLLLGIISVIRSADWYRENSCHGRHPPNRITVEPA